MSDNDGRAYHPTGDVRERELGKMMDYELNGYPQTMLADPLVVSTAEFVGLISGLIEQRDEEARESWIAGEAEKWGVGPLDGYSYIANAVGQDRSNVRRVLTKRKYISLRRADRWLTALGLQHLLGELTVVPNPLWSAERWDAWRRLTGHCG